MDNLSLISAIGENRELGYNNELLWKIKEDLQFYKNTTMGKYVICGRKTFESMPIKAFNGRYPIVISKSKLDNMYDVISFDSIDKVLEFIELNSDKEFMVIGGASIYEKFLPFVDTMYLTEIASSKKADAYFPWFDKDMWDIEELDNYLDEEVPYIRNKYVRKKVM